MTLKNTENNAIINMKSYRRTCSEQDKSELSCGGNYYIKDGKYYITYIEEEGTRVVIKASADSVTVRRMGHFSAVMEYETGRETEFMYRTPYGAIPMQINTHDVVNRLGKNGGGLKFSYSLSSGGGVTENKIKLEVKKYEDEKN